MLGYSVDFGVIYAIMATQSGENALDKRVGKICLHHVIIYSYIRKGIWRVPCSLKRTTSSAS